MVWPTAEQEWVLRFALGSPTDRRPAGDLDVRRLDDTTRRLLPLLYPKLRDLDVRGALRDASEQEYRQTASRNAALFDRGRRLLDELQKAGVATLTLKGAALVVRYYGDAGLRPMADMDVAIPIASLFPSIAALHRGVVVGLELDFGGSVRRRRHAWGAKVCFAGLSLEEIRRVERNAQRHRGP